MDQRLFLAATITLTLALNLVVNVRLPIAASSQTPQTPTAEAAIPYRELPSQEKIRSLDI